MFFYEVAFVLERKYIFFIQVEIEIKFKKTYLCICFLFYFASMFTLIFPRFSAEYMKMFNVVKRLQNKININESGCY